MTSDATDRVIAPVIKARTVGLALMEAFELFTTRMGEWWPMATHSIAGDGAAGIRFEGRLGGRVVELTSAGDEYSWADVVAWDPPTRFVLEWNPTLESRPPSWLEVTFAPTPGGTRVTLTHSGWEALGAGADELRGAYDSGWDLVLGRFEEHAGS